MWTVIIVDTNQSPKLDVLFKKNISPLMWTVAYCGHCYTTQSVHIKWSAPYEKIQTQLDIGKLGFIQCCEKLVDHLGFLHVNKSILILIGRKGYKGIQEGRVNLQHIIHQISFYIYT